MSNCEPSIDRNASAATTSLISSIDPEARRIYLSATSINGDHHPVDIYKEMRTLRRTDESLRPFNIFMTADG
jgi:hypothetical protein